MKSIFFLAFNSHYSDWMHTFMLIHILEVFLPLYLSDHFFCKHHLKLASTKYCSNIGHGDLVNVKGRKVVKALGDHKVHFIVCAGAWTLAVTGTFSLPHIGFKKYYYVCANGEILRAIV